MGIRWRPMRPKDVRECVEIVAALPIIGPRYGSTLADLRTVWLKLLGHEAFRAVVFEESQDSKLRVIGSGVSVFVSDGFLSELKKPPFGWAGPELVKRVMSGDSPLLTDKQAREANRSGGLNLLVWEGTLHAKDFARKEVLQAVFAAFAEQHQGFLLKELIAHSMTVENFEAMIYSGGLFLNDDGRYVDEIKKPIAEIVAEPHYLGLSRDLALSRVGSWMGSLFAYHSPRFGFRPSEQRLLLAALSGGTDEDLANQLGISLSAIKKSWLLIYERVGECDAELIPPSEQSAGSERGKAKKQRLLAYLREHPEELRPAVP